MRSLWPQVHQVVLKTYSWKTVGDLFCELQGKALAQLSQAMWLWGDLVVVLEPQCEAGPNDITSCQTRIPHAFPTRLMSVLSGHVVRTELFMLLLFLLSTLPSVVRYQMSAINI